ncbi:MAG: aldo/keto reductase, partial [SAR86 cluster bacterium]|nr:aldo/keto reductase [SAR86 cluster bacterium]
PMSMSRLVVGAQHGKPFLNPINIEAKGELSSRNIDLNAEAELEFINGSKAFISSAINKTLKNSLLISNEKKSLSVSEPWQCGEQNNRQSEITFKQEGKEDRIIKFKEDKGVFTHEIDHFVDLLNRKENQSEKISHSDSHGNMIWLDTWRKKVGVYYAADNAENREFSLLGKLALKNRGTIPTTRIKGLNKEVSRVVFGCDNQSGSDHAFAMFDHYFSLGGNTFDTAYIYNNGKSDVYLGRWMNHRGLRDEVVVLGKGAHTPDCLPQLIRPQLEESLDRLKTDYLDLYCLHRDNLEVPVNEFIDALNELKEEGLIRLIGASNWSLSRFSESITYAETSGKISFSLLSNNFSLARMLEPVWPGCESCSEDDFKEFLKEKQISIFPWSSQARGFFLDRQEFEGSLHIANPNQQEQNRVWSNADNLERRRRCFSLAKEKGVEPIELALAFVLNQDFPSFPLIGPRNFFETKSSLKALEIELTREDTDWLDLKRN